MFAKITKNWFSVIFIIALVFPTFNGFFGIALDSPSRENRVLAGFPTGLDPDPNLPSRGKFVAYANRFDSYVNDNFFQRNNIIATRNRILLDLNQKSPKPEVILGKDGWYYLGNSNLIKLNSGKLLSENDLKLYVDELVYRKNLVEKQGKKYYMMITPSKFSIYPEYLPDDFKHSGYTIFDQILDYIKNNRIDLEIIDVRPELLEAKKTQQVFYKTDSHWNARAGFIAYTKLINKIKVDFPDITPVTEDEFNIESNPGRRGDLINILGLNDTFENEIKYTYKGSELPISGPKYFTNFGPSSKPTLDHTMSTRYNKASRTVAYFRNSFTGEIMPFISLNFNYIEYPTYTAGIDKSIINGLDPEIVIQQVAEQNIQDPQDYFHLNPELYDQS